MSVFSFSSFHTSFDPGVPCQFGKIKFKTLLGTGIWPAGNQTSNHFYCVHELVFMLLPVLQIAEIQPVFLILPSSREFDFSFIYILDLSKDQGKSKRERERVYTKKCAIKSLVWFLVLSTDYSDRIRALLAAVCLWGSRQPREDHCDGRLLLPQPSGPKDISLSWYVFTSWSGFN